jgi:hypothetical protein
MNVNDNLTNDSQIILNAFNKYFLPVAANINVENLNDKNSLLNNTNPLEYLHDAFKQLFPNIVLKYKTTIEIFYFGIRCFNKLPSIIIDLANDVKCFKLAIKSFLLANSFKCVEEYFDWR